jgi:hypothetical protein
MRRANSPSDRGPSTRRSRPLGSGRRPPSPQPNTPGGPGLRARTRRVSDAVVCAGLGTADWRKRSHQHTPLTLTALPIDTVTVTDPLHPLYGLTCPLLGVTTKQRRGRVCVVWLYPGVARVIPATATDLAGRDPPPPSRCRLSVTGLDALLAVGASQADRHQEDADGTTAHPDHADPAALVAPVARTGAGPRLWAARTTPSPSRGCLDQSLPHDACPGAPHASADDPGGAA